MPYTNYPPKHISEPRVSKNDYGNCLLDYGQNYSQIFIKWNENINESKYCTQLTELPEKLENKQTA